VQFLIIIRVARNDGAQKYYIVAALVPFLFVVHGCRKILDSGSAGERN
jgi:hypothetical protein